jgi:phospholipase A2
MKTRLSDQREKVQNGSAPLPLYTCLHVKSNVSAMVFQVNLISTHQQKLNIVTQNIIILLNIFNILKQSYFFYTQEWYEFTPYEIGIPKYGVFMNTKDFASKFYMGQKVKSFPEVRLHFLYGIWGSAFTILLKRLVQEKGRNGEKEVLKLVLGNSYTDVSDVNNPGCDKNSGSLQDDLLICK